MSGNVAEWVWDAYQPYEPGTKDDPIVSDPAHRISRGGGWPDYLLELQSHTRSQSDGPEWRFDWVGALGANSSKVICQPLKEVSVHFIAVGFIEHFMPGVGIKFVADIAQPAST